MSLKKMIIASAVAASVCGATAAQAHIAVELGGSVDAQFGVRNEKGDNKFLNIDPEGLKRIGEGLVTDTTLTAKATGHFDDPRLLGHTNFGAVVVLDADTSANKFAKPTIDLEITDSEIVSVAFDASKDLRQYNAREVFMFLENDWGRFEYGNTKGATYAMKVDAGTVAAGNGGINGDARLWLNPVTTFGQYMTGDLVTNQTSFYHVDSYFNPLVDMTALALGSDVLFNGVGLELRNAAKFTYYTPSFCGLSAGISYTPDTDVTGAVSNIFDVSKSTSRYGLGFRDVVEGGIHYAGQFRDIGFKAAVLGQTGKTKNAPTNIDSAEAALITRDLGGYQLGLEIDWMGIGIAGSYGRNDGLVVGLDDAKYWTLGAGYEYGPFGFSVNYLDHSQKSANRDNRKASFENLVFDLQYKICDGLMPYISVASFDASIPLTATADARENKGSVVMVGTLLTF